MSEHIQLGVEGEDIAVRYLESIGFAIAERNWRCHAGEIDIVAVEHETLVIVEVKTRRGLGCGHPFEALTATKIARLYRLAVLWAIDHNWQRSFRIDAIAVVLSSTESPRIEHLRALHS